MKWSLYRWEFDIGERSCELTKQSQREFKRSRGCELRCLSGPLTQVVNSCHFNSWLRLVKARHGFMDWDVKFVEGCYSLDALIFDQFEWKHVGPYVCLWIVTTLQIYICTVKKVKSFCSCIFSGYGWFLRVCLFV